MKSQTFEQAEKNYNEKKEELIETMHSEFKGDIDYQGEWDQVAVWFNGFSLCYQNSDMNGAGKGEPHYNNDGANSGLDELKDILKIDDRFNSLIAENEHWENEYLDQLIHDFCNDYAKKHGIADYFNCNKEE